MADNHIGARPSRDIDCVVQSQSPDHFLDLRPQFTVANEGQLKIVTRGFEPSRSFNQKWNALSGRSSGPPRKAWVHRARAAVSSAEKPVIDPAPHDFDLWPIRYVAPAASFGYVRSC